MVRFERFDNNLWGFRVRSHVYGMVPWNVIVLKFILRAATEWSKGKVVLAIANISRFSRDICTTSRKEETWTTAPASSEASCQNWRVSWNEKEGNEESFVEQNRHGWKIGAGRLLFPKKHKNRFSSVTERITPSLVDSFMCLTLICIIE